MTTIIGERMDGWCFTAVLDVAVITIHSGKTKQIRRNRLGHEQTRRKGCTAYCHSNLRQASRIPYSIYTLSFHHDLTSAWGVAYCGARLLVQSCAAMGASKDARLIHPVAVRPGRGAEGRRIQLTHTHERYTHPPHPTALLHPRTQHCTADIPPTPSPAAAVVVVSAVAATAMR
jgi:hypothetical protein